MPEIDEELKKILNDLEKALMNTYKADGCVTSAITEIYKNQALTAIKAWVDKHYERRKG